MPAQKRKSDVIELDSSDAENHAPVAGPSSSKKIKERPDRDLSAPKDLLERIAAVEVDDDIYEVSQDQSYHCPTHVTDGSSVCLSVIAHL